MWIIWQTLCVQLLRHVVWLTKKDCHWLSVQTVLLLCLLRVPIMFYFYSHVGFCFNLCLGSAPSHDWYVSWTFSTVCSSTFDWFVFVSLQRGSRFSLCAVCVHYSTYSVISSVIKKPVLTYFLLKFRAQSSFALSMNETFPFSAHDGANVLIRSAASGQQR